MKSLNHTSHSESIIKYLLNQHSRKHTLLAASYILECSTIYSRVKRRKKNKHLIYEIRQINASQFLLLNFFLIPSLHSFSSLWTCESWTYSPPRRPSPCCMHICAPRYNGSGAKRVSRISHENVWRERENWILYEFIGIEASYEPTIAICRSWIGEKNCVLFCFVYAISTRED